jgi:hypothetical protein
LVAMMRILVVVISIVVSMSMMVSSGGVSTGQLGRHLQVGLAVAVDARVQRYVSGIRVCPCRLVYASTWQAARCCLALYLCASLALHARRHWLLRHWLLLCLDSSARAQLETAARPDSLHARRHWLLRHWLLLCFDSSARA